MTSPSWLLVVSLISAVGAGFLSPPSSEFFLSQNPRYFPPVYFKFPASTTTEVAVTLSPLRISTYSSPPAATPEVRKSPPPPPPPPPPHDHPHPPHNHDHPHPPPPPPPPKKKDRRPSAPAAAQDQDGERSFPGEATLVKFEDWPPVQVYGSQPGINSRVSESLDRSSSPGLDSRKDRRPAADGGQRSWSGTATPVNVEDFSPRVEVYGSQPSGRIITSKSSRVSGEKNLDQSSPPIRVTTKTLTGDRRVQVPAPVVVKSRSYSFAPLDGLGSSETISRSRFQQGRRPSADPVSTTAKSMRARSVPAPVVVRSRSYSFAPPDGLDSSSATNSRFQQQQQQRRRSPPPARDVVSNYVQMNA